MSTPLTDSFNRRLSYLRLSVTDLCNYRCTYCLPNGYQGKARPDELSVAEIDTLVRAFASNGTRKIRLTGGEPTLRRDLADIIAVCKAQTQIENVALTTNAFRLAKSFPSYRAAGLDKLNISIDSFDPDVFFEITGKRECRNILRTLDAILADGFYALKVNTLLLRRYAERTVDDALHFVRQRPVTLRFIELMQTRSNFHFFDRHHLSASHIETRLIERGWQLLPSMPHAGPAREYRHRDFAGGIGFIAPYSQDFCRSCNRLRISAQGKMHLCLFGGIAYDVRPWLQKDDTVGLQQYLHELIQNKPEHHFLHQKKVGLIHDLSMIGG